MTVIIDLNKCFEDCPPEVKLWIGVFEKAIEDLDHDNSEVVEAAERFLFDLEDTKLETLMDLIGLDGRWIKTILRIKYCVF